MSATCDRCFSPRPPVLSINITDRHDITEIFVKDKYHQANKQQHIISVRLAAIIILRRKNLQKENQTKKHVKRIKYRKQCP